MLRELRLRNVAVIDSVALPLDPGLNVLSGETGAGKSLIVGALGLLLGERAVADRIRPGADRAVVEATFEECAAELHEWLAARGVEGDGEVVILKREVSAAGRSRAWVNGSSVTVTLLRQLGAQLVTVHGQHEAQQLLGSAAQRAILDAVAGAQSLAAEVRQATERVQAARQELASLSTRQQEIAKRADYLRFVVEEIDRADVQPDEQEALEVEHNRLAHAHELERTIGHAVDVLESEEGAVLPLLDGLRKALGTMARIDPALERFLTQHDTAYFALEELTRDLQQHAGAVEADPARLQQLELRRGELHQLARKYGPGLQAVLDTADQARAELALIDGHADVEAQLRVACEKAEHRQRELATQLTAKRTAAARTLSAAVTDRLPQLGMAHGQFAVRLAPQPTIGAHGAEAVDFDVALNAGASMAPLDRVASGGELSRVMLALSVALAAAQPAATLVFDEVDAGVGGAVAWEVGALMREVARHHQVLAISHLAQIAASAHHHVVVQKTQANDSAEGVTSADVRVVGGEDRVVELARMLGGDADRAVSRAHAEELLARGQADGDPRVAENRVETPPAAKRPRRSRAVAPNAGGES